MAYEVSTPVFEGPFDLLLHLIAKEQVDLFEVSISRIVDAFLVEIEKMQVLDLEIATEFLLIASTLIELKLRKLLPDRVAVEMEEELALLEERDLLLAKLLEYQTFRHAAQAMRKLEAAAAQSFPRTNVIEERFASLAPDPLASVTANQIRAAFLRAITRAMLPKAEPRVSLSHVTDVGLTVAEAVVELARSLPRMQATTFRALVEDSQTVMEVIVRFLATLELYKQGWIALDQAQSFGEMSIAWLPDGPDVNLSFVPSSDNDSPDNDSEESVEDPEATEIEAELDAAIARAAAERSNEDRPPEAPMALTGPLGEVDDYDG